LGLVLPRPDAQAGGNKRYFDGLANLDDDCVREVECAVCHGEGQFYSSRYGGNDPDVYPTEECPWCRGDGVMWVAAEPIELGDLQND
jgi:hypothetical protein